MVATGFYGFLIYLVYKNIKNKKIKYPLIVMLSVLILIYKNVKSKRIKWISIALLLLLPVLIGISRIYLGAHYATDVIGGWIIGIVYLAFFIKYAYKKMIKKSKKIF